MLVKMGEVVVKVDVEDLVGVQVGAMVQSLVILLLRLFQVL